MEKASYPRLIVFFKPYNCNYFSIKSFEVFYDSKGTEKHSEMYSLDFICGLQNLLKELKEVIYGKDVVSSFSRKVIDTSNPDEIH
jgi:hypothetical protein